MDLQNVTVTTTQMQTKGTLKTRKHGVLIFIFIPLQCAKPHRVSHNEHSDNEVNKLIDVVME